jgi:MFS family permease
MFRPCSIAGDRRRVEWCREVRVRPDIVLLALCFLFFFSGACALVYQILWLRTLGWVFGVTVYAASAVWTTFMAGLAVGSGVAGLVADRVRNPLRWFGATELLIGGTALVTRMVLSRLQQAYVAAYPQGLHDLTVESFDALLAAFTAGPEELAAFVGPGDLLTDDRPLVEYFLSLLRDHDVDLSPLKGDVRRFLVQQ